MIRRAERKDLAAVVDLRYMAGPAVYDHFFLDEAKSRAIIAKLSPLPGTFLSLDYVYVEVLDGTVRGLVAYYPGSLTEDLDRGMAKYGRIMMREMGPIGTLRMALRSGLNRRLPTINDDELYVDSIAVYERFRGQRIASRLLDHATGAARDLGLPKVSLLAEIPNEHAIAVYRKRDFEIALTKELPKRYRRGGLVGFHKMVARVV